MTQETVILAPEEKVQEKTIANPLEKLGSIEEKIRWCLTLMRDAMAATPPRFKDYWEGKRLCLPLFKENVPAGTRTVLWNEYIEISTEARHLKVILDEQSAFAAEQIDLAIKAVEAELEKGTQSKLWDLPAGVLDAKKEVYAGVQGELFVLNALAGRINSLRKEVIRTEMRIRFKNKFFDRLSKAGDGVFPRRKELIGQISGQFLSDMKEFADKTCGDETAPIFALRDDIKTLQLLAKELTLDAKTFNETRLILSKCWDLLKERDVERKKEDTEKRVANQKNVDLILDKIKPLAERCLVETFTVDEAAKHTKEILSFMKTIELSRDDVRFLKDELEKAKDPVYERAQKVQKAREKEMEESQRQRLGKIEEFKKHLKEVLEQVEQKNIDELLQSKEALHLQLASLSATQAEKELLEHSLKELRDRIIDKREKAISSLPPEEKNSLDNLYKMLEELTVQKQEIKAELETYRKAVSGSGFDFEKAIRYRDLLDGEKARFEKVSSAIEEIEEKIDELES